MTARPLMHAEVPAVEHPGRLERLVVVHDPDRGPVPVWWKLMPARPWRCTAHGRQRVPSCAHTKAAAWALARELLGLSRPGARG